MPLTHLSDRRYNGLFRSIPPSHQPSTHIRLPLFARTVFCNPSASQSSVSRSIVGTLIIDDVDMMTARREYDVGGRKEYEHVARVRVTRYCDLHLWFSRRRQVYEVCADSRCRENVVHLLRCHAKVLSLFTTTSYSRALELCARILEFLVSPGLGSSKLCWHLWTRLLWYLKSPIVMHVHTHASTHTYTRLERKTLDYI